MTVEENDELVSYRLKKAKEALKDATDLVESKKWNLAVNRIYYASFYAVIALLAKKEIYTKTHAGAKQMFGLHFIKTGAISAELSNFYVKVFSMRQSGDYEDFCDYEETDVIDLLVPANELINTIETRINCM